MKRLLIVEDHKNFRLLCRLELEAAGYRVIEAEEARKAPEAVQQNRPDLVVFAPPRQKSNWLPLMEEIRKIDRILPVVIHTGCPLCQRDAHRCLADACILKSSNLGPLKQAISCALERRAVVRENNSHNERKRFAFDHAPASTYPF